MAAGHFAKEFYEEMVCPICLDYFTDPVTTDCGHNFCRTCLTQCWGEQDINFLCPQCRETVQQSSLRPNRPLANIIEISKKFSLPVVKKDAGGACGRHEEPLKFFCKDDEAPICVVCDRSKEHREHQVIPVEEAAEEYKEKIQADLQFLEQERQLLVERKETEKQRIQKCLEEIEADKQKIRCAVEKMHRYLQEKEDCWLRQLADLEAEIKRMQEENTTRVSEKISHFNNLIKDVQLKCQQPPDEFLQDIRITLNRCQDLRMKGTLELSPGLEWKLRSNSPKMSDLNKAIKDIEGSLIQAMSKVSVTLDPDTAHPFLILSKDLKSVRCGNYKQKLPYNPKRFDKEFCVLGSEIFTSGRHCWEVKVEMDKLNKKEMWAMGVAQESISRKGWIFLSVPEGIWAVGKDSSQPHAVLAYTFLAPTTVALKSEPKKIRLFLDYEEGRVEFFDADTEDLIFTFPPASFSGEGIRPFFWVISGVTLKC